MSRRLALGFISLLAVTAFVLVPAVTQAKGPPRPPRPPVWVVRCHHPGGELKKCQAITWGTLTFTIPPNPVTQEVVITCKKSDAENIWNPPGAAGRDEVVLLDFYECQSVGCKNNAVKASGLPWPTELFRSGGNIFNRIKNIQLEVCEIPFTGELTPRMVNNNPTFEEFTAASGSLVGPSGSGLVVTVTGIDKIMGFENQEKITVR